ncbi:M81 family metallopeptidase [Ottowia thiooxydans]|uniref:M81 family metallopeptidase n=1 Tax=Ottowia thiooxydans TaxID=219182 RepID=UPI000416D465|nr:M81 family metallopeptidase [Ottowia thiooxydans]
MSDTLTKRRYRVAVARFYHESNRFNPQPTLLSQLSVQVGVDLFPFAGSSTLAGIIAELDEAGVEILPLLSVSGPPSGLIAQEVYAGAKAQLISMLVSCKPDAIVLDLHGAMGTTELADADGDLLCAIRQAVGAAVPLGVGLDLHANLTTTMLTHADICIACKENPHSDVMQCGKRVARLVLSMLDGELKPVTACARLPMALPGAGETATGPLAEIHQAARDALCSSPAIEDISIYNVFRSTDHQEFGQVVTVLSNGLHAESPAIAKRLVGLFWENRERFVDELLSIDEAFRHVACTPVDRPFVLADMGDRILAGAPGDSVMLLSAVLDHYPQLRGALTVTDPENAHRALQAGLGATVTLQAGGQITPGFHPRCITGEVVHVGLGDFVLAGPFQGGDPSSLGPCAVVLVDRRIAVLLTTQAAYSHDPAVLTSQGIVIEEQDFVVVKSGYHFTLNFAGLATPLLVRTPGVGYYTKGMFKYEKSRFWPDFPMSDADIEERVFSEASRSFQ